MQVKMYIWFIKQLADLNKLYSPGLSSSLPCKFQRKHSYLSEGITEDCPQWRHWEPTELRGVELLQLIILQARKFREASD